MKLAVSNIAWEAGDDAHIYSLMEELGFSGLEIAPTRIFPSAPYDDLPAARRWAQELMRTHGFTVPSMQSIWFGRGERLFGSAQFHNNRAMIGCYRFIHHFRRDEGKSFIILLKSHHVINSLLWGGSRKSVLFGIREYAKIFL